MTDSAQHRGERAADPEMGERIRRAWADGALTLPLRDGHHALRLPGQPKHTHLPGLAGESTVELLGTGEAFAAWRLVPAHGPELLVRVPWHEPTHPLADELAALTQLPPGVGPEPIALHEDAALSPLDAPYLVTTPVPGRIVPPEQWTHAHLLAHADRLALLHQVAVPGRGPISLGEDPWARMAARAPSLLDLLEEDASTVDGALVDRIDAGPILRAVRARLRRAEGAFRALEGFVLSHGDLCATNVVWDRADGTGDPPLPRFIDFEWAMGDDPARDLAIIGGAVHGGPWYVPMDDAAIEALLARYLEARHAASGARLEGQLPSPPPPELDPRALRVRRDAWELFEKTAMLLFVGGRAEASTLHAQALPVLRSTLAARLGVA